MFKKTYLAAAISAITVGSMPVYAESEENVVKVDKLTVVGDKDNLKLMTLDQQPKVSKTGAKLADLPYSVAVINKEFMQETGAKSIQDALLYSSGIYSAAFGIDTRVDSAKIRGVDPLYYVDGLRSIYGFYNNVRPSTYALEQIEVMKGPSSVMFGQGSVGGIVNSVTKRPKEEEQGEIWLQGGSFGRKQVAADWTGALDQEGKFLFRMVGLARDSGTQVNHVDDDEVMISPALTWRPNKDTELTVMANYQERDGGITAQFLPTQGTLIDGPLGKVDPSTFVGEPDWDRYDRRQAALTTELKHNINDTWRVTAVARYVDAETNTREHWANIGVAPTDEGLIGRTVFSSDKSTQGLNWDLRFNGDLELGATEHKVLIGIDRQDVEIDEWNRGYSTNTAINLYAPTYGNIPADFALSDPAAVTTEQLGFYLADSIRWGNTIISLAARHDKVTTTTEGSAGIDNNATTGHVGLMYQFNSGISPYVSYSESFEPNNGTDGTGGLLDPTEGEQVEVGIKYLSPDNSTQITLAHFDIEQLNRVSNGATPGGLRQTGAEIDGWELEVRKQWDQLSVLFNYSNLDAVDGDGGVLPYLAETQASLWTNYKFSNGIRAGLGIRHTGENYGWGGSPEIDGVTLVDAMIGYEMGNWDFTADVKNLTDKTYVAWCRSAGTDCGFGEKLNATVNARYKF